MNQLTAANETALAETTRRGEELFRRDRLDEAKQLFERVIEVDPVHAPALHMLGLIAHLAGRNEDATALLAKALAKDPLSAAYHSDIAEVYRALEMFDQSLAASRKAIELAPGFAEAHANLGNALHDLGNLADAAEAYRRAVSLKPGLCRVYLHLSTMKTFTRGDEDIAAMERLLRDTAASDSDRMHLCFALGKAYDDLARYDEAFAYFEQGNALRFATVTTDFTRTEPDTTQIIDTFDGSFLASAAGRGPSDDTPIFILGMPRSGTTLVEQILAAHPDVHGAGELMAMARIVDDLPRRFGCSPGFPECLHELSAEHLAEIGDAYLATAGEGRPERPRMTDKMPSNYRFVGLIHLVLPGARIIHCTRDPIDTCLSCFKTCFVAGQEFSYDLAELGRQHRQYQRLMDHWRATIPDALLEVAYEDVVRDVEETTRRILEYCGLTWHEACIRFHEVDRPVRTASANQVRRPLYGSSVGQWRHYERHLEPLIDALGRPNPPALAP